METNPKPTLRHPLRRQLNRALSVIGISMMLQTGPGSMITSWAIDCSPNSILDEGEFCVGNLEDSNPSSTTPDPSSDWTLREAIESINAEDNNFSAIIGFRSSLFPDQSEQFITLNSALEIKKNITIIGPQNNGGDPLLTIQRASDNDSPLFDVNPTASNSSTNQATEVVRLENVTLSGGSTSGTLINVQAADAQSQGAAQPVPTVELVNVTAQDVDSAVGGSVITTPGNVVVQDSTLTGNTATSGDGGAISAGGDVTVENSVLTGNTATSGDGGAISAGGDVTVINSDISHNSATSGGAISAGGDVSISDSSNISVNSATAGDGGAISAGGAVDIQISTLVVNTATTGDGGAISAGGTVTIDTVTLGSNTAGGDGGAISATGTVTVENSSLGNNTADGNGGAISATSAVSITGSNASHNEAIDGGAIFSDSTVVISNSTLNQNSALGEGGAVLGTDVFVENSSILSANTSMGNGGAIAAFGAVNISDSNFGYIEVQNSWESEQVVETIGNSSGRSGGSIHSSGPVTITDSTFRYSEADENGGAIKSSHSVQVSGSSLTNNRANGYGGAIDIDDDSSQASSIINSDLISNIASSGGAIDGGRGLLTIQHTNFNLNVAVEQGGAIWNIGSVIIEDGSRFESNVAVGPLISMTDSLIDYEPQVDFDWQSINKGGAIHISTDEFSAEELSVTLEIRDSEFNSNLALGDGGAISFQGLMYVLRSRFEYNVSLIGDGGAINGSSVFIVSSQFNSNYAAIPEMLFDVCADETSDYFTLLCYGNGEGGAISGNQITIDSDIDGLRSEFIENVAMNDGGAIQVDGWIDISDVDFVDNVSIRGDGGAIDIAALYNEINEEFQTFTSSLQSTYFFQNTSDGDGGAIDGSEGTIEVRLSSFDRNYAGDDGGAIWNGGHVIVLESQFSDNYAYDDAGALYADSVEIARTRFTTNESETGDGGAISIRNSSNEPQLSVIISSIFQENRAGNYGGAIDGSAWVITSTFAENMAGLGGSAIALEGSLATQLIGSLVTGNSDTPLCRVPFFNSPSTYATDSSCFNPEFVEVTGTGGSYVISLEQILEEAGSFPGSYFLTENNGYFELISNLEAINGLVDYFSEIHESSTGVEQYLTYQESRDSIDAFFTEVSGETNELDEIVRCWDMGSCLVEDFQTLRARGGDWVELADIIQEMYSEKMALIRTISVIDTDGKLARALNDLYENEFIEANLVFDVNNSWRPKIVNWTVGAVQLTTDPNIEDHDNGSEDTNNDVVVTPPSDIEVPSSRPEVDQFVDDDAQLMARARAEELARAEQLRIEAQVKEAAELAAKEREAQAALKAQRRADLEKRRMATKQLAEKGVSRRELPVISVSAKFSGLFSKRGSLLHSSRPI